MGEGREQNNDERDDTSTLNAKFVEEEMSAAIRAALKRSSFNTPGTLLSGVIFVVFAAGVTAEKSGLLVLWAATVFLALTGVARLYTVKTYYDRQETLNESELSKWMFRYKLGAMFQAVAIGSWAFGAITLTDDTIIHMIAVAVAAGLTSGGAGRAYGQQKIFHHQALIIFCPLTLALFLKLTPHYIVLSILTSAYIIAISKISANLSTIFLRSETSKQEVDISRRQLDIAVSNLLQGLVTFRSNGKLALMNRRFRELAGLPFDIVKRDPSVDDICNVCVENVFITAENAKKIITAVRAGTSAYIVTTKPDGSQATSWTIQSTSGNGVVLLLEDITERRNAEKKIAHLATHDGLTDLPNRVGFQNMVEPVLREDNNRLSAILYIDLDHFKEVNDTLGHDVGDRLLSMVARRLRLSIREQDIAARFGGDEFCVFVPDLESENAAAIIAARIVETLGQQYRIDKASIEIGASVGVTFTRPFAAYSTLLKNADLALYAAKDSGRGVHRFFHPEMAATAETRRALETDFKAALDNFELELHFQPIVDLETRKINICEALLRWKHPIRGFIPPQEIIKVAQETGRAHELGRWIVEQACTECAKWPENVAVAINVSPRIFQVKEIDVVGEARKRLAVSGLSPSRVIIEITEEALLDNTDNTHKILNALSGLGIGIALDDFGIGYSSLSYLPRFPFQKIKIDRTFLDDIDKDRAVTVMCKIAELATELGMSVVVEGIETWEQLALVTKCSQIREGQGYLFSQPVPAAQIREFLIEAQATGLKIVEIVTDAPPLKPVEPITETSPACPVPTAPDTQPSARRRVRRSSGQSRQRRGTDKAP